MLYCFLCFVTYCFLLFLAASFRAMVQPLGIHLRNYCGRVYYAVFSLTSLSLLYHWCIVRNNNKRGEVLQHGGSSVLCYNYLSTQRFWFSLGHWNTIMQSKDKSWVQEACVYDPTQSFKTQDPSNSVAKASEHLGRTSDVQPCLRVFQVWKWAVVPCLCSGKLTVDPEDKCFLLSPLRACRTCCSWSMFTEDLSDGLCTKQTRATPPTPE